MCLSYNEIISKRIRGLLGASPTKTRTLYKIYRVNKYKNQTGSGISLKTIYFGKKKNITKPGEVISNRVSLRRTRHEKENSVVNQGIHVFSNKKEAYSFRFWSFKNDNSVVVPVTCSLNDFVAGGTFNCKTSSVFMKVKIEKETWTDLKNKILKGK